MRVVIVTILVTIVDLEADRISGIAPPKLSWPTEYHYTGTEADLLKSKTHRGGINVNKIEVWYSESRNKARIDIVAHSEPSKSYYFDLNSGKLIPSRMITYQTVPKHQSDDDFTSSSSEVQITCKKLETFNVDPSFYLMPDITRFKYSGKRPRAADNGLLVYKRVEMVNNSTRVRDEIRVKNMKGVGFPKWHSKKVSYTVMDTEFFETNRIVIFGQYDNDASPEQLDVDEESCVHQDVIEESEN